MNAKLCRLRAWFVLCGLALLCAPQARGGRPRPAPRSSSNGRGKRIEGTPLAANATGIELLGRDGRLWIFPAQAAREAKQVSSSFSGYPATVMKGALAGRTGQRLSSRLDRALPRGDPGRSAQRLGRSLRRFVPLVCALFRGARLSVARSGVSADRHRVAEPGEFSARSTR